MTLPTFTVTLTQEQLRLLTHAAESKLHDLQAEAEGSDFQHCRDRAEKELPHLKAAVEQLRSLGAKHV